MLHIIAKLWQIKTSMKKIDSVHNPSFDKNLTSIPWELIPYSTHLMRECYFCSRLCSIRLVMSNSSTSINFDQCLMSIKKITYGAKAFFYFYLSLLAHIFKVEAALLMLYERTKKKWPSWDSSPHVLLSEQMS